MLDFQILAETLSRSTTGDLANWGGVQSRGDQTSHQEIRESALMHACETGRGRGGIGGKRREGVSLAEGDCCATQESSSRHATAEGRLITSFNSSLVKRGSVGLF